MDADAIYYASSRRQMAIPERFLPPNGRLDATAGATDSRSAALFREGSLSDAAEQVTATVRRTPHSRQRSTQRIPRPAATGTGVNGEPSGPPVSHHAGSTTSEVRAGGA